MGNRENFFLSFSFLQRKAKMATRDSPDQGNSTSTVLDAVEGAFNFPRPSRRNTLRLRLRPDAVQTPEQIEREASEALETLLKDLEKVSIIIIK